MGVTERPILTRAFLSGLTGKGTVALCGIADHGQVVRLARQPGFAGRIYCVEANPATVQRLEDALRHLNGRVAVLPGALCSEPGPLVSLHINQNPVSTSIFARAGTTRTVRVPTLSLARLLDITGPLEWLAMDIEGAELQVFGMLDTTMASRIKGIRAELHPDLWNETPIDTVAANLEDLGYTVGITPSGRRPELTARRQAKRDRGWQRYFDPADVRGDALRRRFAWIAGRIAGTSFLDVGCSNGVGLFVAGRTGRSARLVGIDASETAIAEAKVNLSRVGVAADVLVGRGETLPFEAGEFATVFLGEILEHVENDSVVLKEAMRVLKAGGTAIVTVPLGGHITPEHRRTYSLASATELCRRAGLSEIECAAIPSGGKTPWLCLAGKKGA